MNSKWYSSKTCVTTPTAHSWNFFNCHKIIIANVKITSNKKRKLRKAFAYNRTATGAQFRRSQCFRH